jgi:glycosyltransferase involved in cell wall biosynthesis
MRVGLVTYGLDRPLTGIGRYTLELIQAFSGCDERRLDLILLSAGRSTALNANSYSQVMLPGCRLLPGLMTLGNLLILSISRHLKLDIVHDPTGVSPFLMGAGGAKTIVTVHDVFAWSCPGHSSILDTLLYRYWLPHILTRVDTVITVSRRSQTDIQRYLALPANRLQVIPYGIASRFHPLPPEKVRKHLFQRFGLSMPYILYVGALTKRKNVERALEAFALLSERLSATKLQFVLAGPRTWKQTRVEATLRELGLANRVLLTGPLTDSDLPALYSGAELFVFPSLCEGFGLPPLEAMACGTPVVCSNTTSLPEVVADAAMTIDPYDVVSLAEAMEQVLRNRNLSESLRQKGLARAAQFTWDQTAKETVKLYRRVLGI